MKQPSAEMTSTDRITRWVGSLSSLVLHTVIFIAAFVAVAFGLLALNTMLLILTTAVSLEAIYLAIFIQMTVNENTASLREVEEDIDEIQEDVEEMSEDIDEIQEDIDEIQEDDEEDEEREKRQTVSLEQLTASVRKILEDLEALKAQK